MRKRLVESWFRMVIVAAIGLSFGCVGEIDDGSSSAASDVAYCRGQHGQLGHNQHNQRVNWHEVLVVNLGASISAGYTLDPALLGLEFDPIYADNHHIPRLAELVGDALATEIDSYNLAIPGATSTEIATEQLPDALAEIGRYRKGAVITIEAGGNDLRAFQVEHLAECMSPEPADQYACIVALSTTFAIMDANLHAMLSGLREVAPTAPIIVQTQYNPLYGVLPNGVPCADDYTRGFADVVFEGTVAAGAPIDGMNPRIRAIAAEYGAGVADIGGYLYQSGEYSNPIYFSSDCTHPAGTRAEVSYLGLPADPIGAGFEAHYNVFAYALSTLL